jgi:hypothetical protein
MCTISINSPNPLSWNCKSVDSLSVSANIDPPFALFLEPMASPPEFEKRKRKIKGKKEIL